MSLGICAIASGSRGNCTLITGGGTKVLVDIGIPLYYTERSLQSLGIAPREIDAVLVTHEHTDHVSGIAAFARKYGAPVYVHNAAARRIIARLQNLSADRVCDFWGSAFKVGGLEVSPVDVPHDVPCVGFTFSAGGESVSVVTDLGAAGDEVLERLSHSSIVALEANHDPDMLRASRKYPAALKRRILSDSGHLSNRDSGDALAKLFRAGALRQAVLSHLSMENNYPSLALSTVSAAFLSGGIPADAVKLHVAEQYKVGEVISV